MNLYIRLIYLLIKAFFHKEAHHPLDRLAYTLNTWPNDLDLNLHVNNGRYLTILDLGRIDLMFKTKLSRLVFKNKWVPVLGGANVRFVRPAKAFQKCKMTTQVVYWDEKWVYMEQQIFHKDKLMFHAYVKAIFLAKHHKIEPSVLMDHLEHDLVRPEPPKALRQWILADMN